MKSRSYISYSKDALTAINGEVNSSGVAFTSGSHGLVKVNHYSWIEKLAPSIGGQGKSGLITAESIELGDSGMLVEAS